MALSLSQKITTVMGNKKMTVTDVTFDSSYPTGGEAVTAATFGLGALEVVIPLARGGYDCVWDATNSKLIVNRSNAAAAYAQDGSVEVLDTTDLSTLVVTVIALGA